MLLAIGISLWECQCLQVLILRSIVHFSTQSLYLYLCSGLDPNNYCISTELSLEILLSVDASILKVLCSSGSLFFTDVIMF